MITVSWTDALFLFLVSAFLALFYWLVAYFIRNFGRRRRANTFTVENIAQNQPPSALEQHPSWDKLTPREKEIARLVAQGKRNAEIACELQVAESTVHSHIKKVFDKFGIHTRAGLAHALRNLPE